MKRKSVIRFLEFFVIGLVMGITEDVIAIFVSTGTRINFKIIAIAFLVTLPFAAFSELVVDHPDFWSKLFKKSKKRK